jgi:peptide/nickel transport system permease protein
LSVAVLLVVTVLVAFGGALAPHDPLAQNTDVMLQGPSAAHWLGTDYLGRDVLSRLMAGSRLSVLGALEAVAVAMLLGVGPGLASAWFGRRLEWLALRLTDTLMVLPFTVFAIAVVGTLGNGLHQSMVAIGVLMTPLYFRVTRAAALGLRQMQYVEAAELMGASQWFVLRRHIWSKVLPTVAVTTAQAIGSALLVMASLTFLGLGVTPPAPSWGGMLGSDLAYLTQQAWAPLIPGVMIMLTVGSLNLLADVIREVGPDSVRRGWRRQAAAGIGVTRAARTTTTLEEDRDVRAPAA